MLYIAAKEDKKNIWEERVKFLDCKEKNITQLIFPTSSVLEVQKGKPCWNVEKFKGSFSSQDPLSPMLMNHKINTTKQSHQIWSVVQVHH